MPDAIAPMVYPQAKAGEVRQKHLSRHSTTPSSLQMVLKTSSQRIPFELFHNPPSSRMAQTPEICLGEGCCRSP